MNCFSKNKKLNVKQQLLSSYKTAYKDMYYVLLCLMIEALMLNSIIILLIRTFPNRLLKRVISSVVFIILHRILIHMIQ